MTENIEHSIVDPYQDKPAVVSRLLQKKDYTIQLSSSGDKPETELSVDTRNPLGSGDLSIILLGEMSDSKEVVVQTFLPNEKVTKNAEDKKIANDEFVRGGELLLKSDHPNIAHAYGVGEISISELTSLPVIVREKFETTLSDVVEDGDQDISVVDVISQTAQALHYLNENGALVTDVNPGNIGIRDDKSVAIFDVNLTKRSGDGKVGGVGVYVAPELSVVGQKDEEKVSSATERSQVYSLGAIAYVVLAGKGAKDDLALTDINKEMITNVPEEVGDVLIKSLSRNPNDRYENPIKMAEALQEVIDGKKS